MTDTLLQILAQLEKEREARILDSCLERIFADLKNDGEKND